MKLEKQYLVILACLFSFAIGIAFSTVGIRQARASDDIDAVNKVIDDFQTAYSAKKIQDVQNLFHYKAVVGIDFFSNTDQKIMSLVEWISATKEIFKEKSKVSDELTDRQIEVHRGSLATVVCNYDYRDQISHQAGVDIFTLMKIKGKWKIISLVFSGDDVKKK